MEQKDDEIVKVTVDEFTGILPQDNDISCRKDFALLLSQSEAFQQLVQTKGWKILKEFIDGQVFWMTQSLKVETDINKIMRLQSEIIAFESLEKIIETSFVNAEQAKKQLLDLVTGSA